jgi:hypothetical protein
MAAATPERNRPRRTFALTGANGNARLPFDLSGLSGAKSLIGDIVAFEVPGLNVA